MIYLHLYNSILERKPKRVGSEKLKCHIRTMLDAIDLENCIRKFLSLTSYTEPYDL